MNGIIGMILKLIRRYKLKKTHEEIIKNKLHIPTTLCDLMDRGIIIDEIKVTPKLAKEIIENRMAIDRLNLTSDLDFDKFLTTDNEFSCFYNIDLNPRFKELYKNPEVNGEYQYRVIGCMFGINVVVKEKLIKTFVGSNEI